MKRPLDHPDTQAKLLAAMKAAFDSTCSDHEAVRGLFSRMQILKGQPDVPGVQLVEVRLVVRETAPSILRVATDAVRRFRPPQ